MSEILVDIGSSTIKVYSHQHRLLEPLVARSVPFKNGFDPEGGVSAANKKELFELMEAIQEKNKNARIKIYATSIFRKLAPETRVAFVDEFFERSGLFFNIINQDLESFYLEVALVGKSLLDKPVLLINIGGGSTELVVMYGKEAVERKNLDLGVGTINSEFSGINEPLSKVKLEEAVEFVKKRLPALSNAVKVAFYSGGELTYMQLARYPLLKNVLFKDADHPSIISLREFSQKNGDVFGKMKLEELEALMPNNPTWMHGARGCSAIAQAICERYKIETIVPSDSNIINGVVRQEFRYVTISGSFRKYLKYILKVRERLANSGAEILSPRFTEPKNPGEELERHHLDSIVKSDALVVCDPHGYVGASALIEVGFANSLGKRIIFTEKPEEFMLNTLPAEVGL